MSCAGALAFRTTPRGPAPCPGKEKSRGYPPKVTRRRGENRAKSPPLPARSLLTQSYGAPNFSPL